MRLVYTSSNQQQALQLSEFLKNEGIENQCEIQTNRDWGSENYGDVQCSIWVVEEEQTDIALRWIEKFEADPKNEIFQKKERKSLFSQPPPPPDRREPIKRNLGSLTFLLLIACSLLFFFAEVTTPSEEIQVNNLPAAALYMPEVYKRLLYDYPKAFEIVDKLVKAYGLEKLQQPLDLPPEGKLILNQYAATPYWQGIYKQLVVHTAKPGSPWNFAGPFFEKIRQGEVWRLITPILLHANIFHLFFNMLWLIVLGKLIEERLGIWRYLLLIAIIAAISNTAQYLMSGSNFLGISGVIVGMLGFIWSRQSLAPWESYRLTPGVFTFMASFILGIAFIQLIVFFQEAFSKESSFPAIASTAHLVGGFVGWLLGRFDIFSSKQVAL